MSYETPELLDRCLRSVMLHAGPGVATVVVVDNSVTDRCAAVVREGFPSVGLLRPPTNIGYGCAANLGVSVSSAPAVLVLNADTTLTPKAVEAMRSELASHPRAAVVGPRLVDDQGRSHPSCAAFPTVARVLVNESGIWKVFGTSRLATSWRPFVDPQRSVEVPWLLGAALLVRRVPFEAVGGFDPAYFMYFEEVDLCRRLDQAGFTTRFCPDARVHHIGAASTSTQPAAMRRVLYRSLATYFRRHGAGLSVAGLRCVVVVVAVLRLGRDVAAAFVRRQPRSALAAARSWMTVIADAVRGWR